ncbi:UNVERIFIED_CONTAM: hypothetical protein HDU68_002786 [Siphonaria sp. JEL0065]|nr:hypothetical protein HDU68_002786 [Siphonaria sp. JEL0065]
MFSRTASAVLRQQHQCIAGLSRKFSVLSLGSLRPGIPSVFAPSTPISALTPSLTSRVAGAAVSLSQNRGNAGTKKKMLSAVQLRNQVKVASKRKGKHYKLKNHRGALTRCVGVSIQRLLINPQMAHQIPTYARGPVFKRAQAGTSHLNRKNRAWKTRSKRRRLTANTQQAKLLRRLIPYHRKKYMR